MNKLTKDQTTRWEAAQTDLETAAAGVNAVRGEVEAAITAAIKANLPKLKDAIASWEDAVSGIASLKEEFAYAMDDYASERSEDWAEGEAGAQHARWHDAWTDLDLEPGGEDALDLMVQTVRDDLGDDGSLDIPNMDDLMSDAGGLPLTREEA